MNHLFSGQCEFKEESTEEPSYEHIDPAENLTILKTTKAMKTDSEVTTIKPTTLVQTVKVDTYERLVDKEIIK